MASRILMVCLGNICRSPLAEAALRRECENLGIAAEIDSAGTGDWHIGHAPDPRAQAVARRNGCDIAMLRARQVRAEDFSRFDHLIAMDTDNLAELGAMRSDGARAQLSLLLDYASGRTGQSVADPYYGGDKEFDTTWREVAAGARGLAAKLR